MSLIFLLHCILLFGFTVGSSSAELAKTDSSHKTIQQNVHHAAQSPPHAPPVVHHTPPAAHHTAQHAPPSAHHSPPAPVHHVKPTTPYREPQYPGKGILLDQTFIFSNRPLISEFFNKISEAHNIPLSDFDICLKHLNPEQTKPHGKHIYFHLVSEHGIVDKVTGWKSLDDKMHVGKAQNYYKNDTYLVHFPSKDCYKMSEIVLDYSAANVENVKISELFDATFVNKIVYVPAIPFAYEPFHGAHNKIELMTAMLNVYGRRLDMIQQINKKLSTLNVNKVHTHDHAPKNVQTQLNGTISDGNQTHTGINNNRKLTSESAASIVQITNVQFNDIPSFIDMLDNTKIMFNVHQSEFCHNLEEFRVLPALLRGVVIVSEWVPLSYSYPYAEYIVFAPYDELVDKTIEVMQNYEHYRDKFFGARSKLNETVIKMKQDSYKNFENVVLRTYFGTTSSNSTV